MEGKSKKNERQYLDWYLANPIDVLVEFAIECGRSRADRGR